MQPNFEVPADDNQEFLHSSMCNDSEYCKKAIKEIIKHNKHLEIGPDGHTLLHYAAVHGDKESAQILLDKQVPINSLDKEGDSALSIALHEGKTDFAKFLLEKGANIHEYNDFGYTPLQEITLRREVDNENRIKALEFLLQNGADPELPVKKCSPGFTASGGKSASRHEGRKITDILATASDWNQMQAKEVVELIKKLYEFGANIRTKEEYENQHNIRKSSKAEEIAKGIFKAIIPENILERDNRLFEDRKFIKEHFQTQTQDYLNPLKESIKKSIFAGNLIDFPRDIEVHQFYLEILKSIAKQELIENSEKHGKSGLYPMLEKINELDDDEILKQLSQINTNHLKVELKKSIEERDKILLENKDLKNALKKLIFDGNLIEISEGIAGAGKVRLEALKSVTQRELIENSEKLGESGLYPLLEKIKELGDNEILTQLSEIKTNHLKAELKKSILDGNIIEGFDNANLKQYVLANIDKTRGSNDISDESLSADLKLKNPEELNEASKRFLRNDTFNRTLLEVLRSITREELEMNSKVIKEKTINDFAPESKFYNLLKEISEDDNKILSDNKILEQLSKINRNFLGIDISFSERLRLQLSSNAGQAFPTSTPVRAQSPAFAPPPPYNPFYHPPSAPPPTPSVPVGVVILDQPSLTQTQTSNPSSLVRPVDSRGLAPPLLPRGW